MLKENMMKIIDEDRGENCTNFLIKVPRFG